MRYLVDGSADAVEVVAMKNDAVFMRVYLNRRNGLSEFCFCGPSPDTVEDEVVMRDVMQIIDLFYSDPEETTE